MNATNETPMDSLTRKIRALHAKARGTNNEHEAATFAAKVQELLEKHNLSADVLAEQKTSRHGGVAGHRTKQKGWDSSPYRKALVAAVCSLYYCKALYYSGTGEFLLIGTPSNVATAKYMIEYLLETVLRASKEYGAETNKARLDFRRGMIMRLCSRLHAMLEEKQREERMRSGNNPGNLPALYANTSALIEDFIKETVGKTKTSRQVRPQGTEAFYAGSAKGKTISLNQQIGAKQ